MSGTRTLELEHFGTEKAASLNSKNRDQLEYANGTFISSKVINVLTEPESETSTRVTENQATQAK